MKEDKAVIATMTLIIIGVVILAGAGGTYIAKSQGYIPWLEYPALPEDYKEEQISNLPCDAFFDFIKSTTPSIKDIDYKFYRLNLVPSDVLSEYKDDLIKNGYKVFEFNGEQLYGSTTVSGYNGEIYYGAFVKGITGVVVLATGQTVETPEYKEGSCVVYAVGDLWSYKTFAEEFDNMLDSVGVLSGGGCSSCP